MTAKPREEKHDYYYYVITDEKENVLSDFKNSFIVYNNIDTAMEYKFVREQQLRAKCKVKRISILDEGYLKR